LSEPSDKLKQVVYKQNPAVIKAYLAMKMMHDKVQFDRGSTPTLNQRYQASENYIYETFLSYVKKVYAPTM